MDSQDTAIREHTLNDVTDLVSENDPLLFLPAKKIKKDETSLGQDIHKKNIK
jgi:hypothetical protein